MSYFWLYLTTLFILLLLIPVEYLFHAVNNRNIKNKLLNLFIGMPLFIIFGGIILNFCLYYLPDLSKLQSNIDNSYLYCISYLILQDTLFYFYHRLQHSNSLLWAIHKFHHTEPELNITTSYRTNFIEHPLQYFIVHIPCLLLLGININGIIISLIIAKFFLLFGHSNIKISLGTFSKIFVDPQVHRLHHARSKEYHNCNYAQIFSFIDILFGTYQKPIKGYYPESGLDGYNTINSQIKAMAWPFGYFII